MVDLTCRKWRVRVFILFLLALFLNLYLLRQDNPVEYSQSPLQRNITKEQEINIKYCGSPVCKFLFPGYVGEQESKAQLHIGNIMRLAEKTNRILVLPNVGNSRIGSCKSFPFDYYFSLESIRESAPGLKFILQSDLLNWLEERKKAYLEHGNPSSHLIFIDAGQDSKSNFITTGIFDLTNSKNHRHLCIDPFYKPDELPKIPEITLQTKRIYWKTRAERTQVGNFLVRNFKELESEVLILHYNLRFSFVEELPPPLVYAKHIIDRAHAATKFIHPYVAVHWRMENANPENMPNCAQKLVLYIQKLRQKHKIENVYLATDYNIEGGPSNSGTFRLLTNQHEEAINILRKELNFYTWSKLPSPESPVQYPHSESKNSSNIFSKEHETGASILGILDKLVLMHADWFVSGPSGCCKGSSSYTNQIVDLRFRIMNQQEDEEKLQQMTEKVEAKEDPIELQEEDPETFREIFTEFKEEEDLESKFSSTHDRIMMGNEQAKLLNTGDKWDID
ncbi:hypothetical protein G9A89_009039 [Geosiphon pyriformis]|nr:hypothetical protein G9A89_009039 [Geosiphon pyriformis]